ncbi:MAG: hypothetical protein KBF56_07035 [Gemmatimonadaceae bacterium]|nr:hypothetical protein [Gemmatimonadaceae bacterium]
MPPLDDDEVVDEMAHGYGCLDAAITLWRLVDPARAESLRALLVRVAAASDRYTRFAGDDLAALIQMLSGVGAALQAAGIVDEHCRIPPEHLDELKRHVPAMDLELNRPLHCKTAALVEVIVLTRAVLTEVLAERAWPGPLRLDDYLPDGIAMVLPKCTLFFEEGFESDMSVWFDADQVGLDEPVSLRDIMISRGGIETPGLVRRFSPRASLDKVKDEVRDLCTILFTHFRSSLDGDFVWVPAYRAHLTRGR